MRSISLPACIGWLIAMLAPSVSSSVTIEWIVIDDAGNVADTELMSDGTTGYGSVGYAYRVSKYEITNSQYTEFLNSVAKTDTHGLYNTNMALTGVASGGILRSGTPGSFTYTVRPGMENKPVNWVSEYDALRFANWLHNDQPSGSQDGSTTEDGSYSLMGSNPLHIGREPDATIVLTSENEWYKAAYYDPSSNGGAGGYWNYPTRSDVVPSCEEPPGGTNSAACANSGSLMDVGSYIQSPSPYGTFDQAGNLFELTEALGGPTNFRVHRGGSFDSATSTDTAASGRFGWGAGTEDHRQGFRLAFVPEPSGCLLLVSGVLVLTYRRYALRSRAN